MKSKNSTATETYKDNLKMAPVFKGGIMNKKSAGRKLLIMAVMAAFISLLGFFVTELYIPVSLSKKAEKVRVEVPSGTSTKKIASTLKNEGLVRSQFFFYAASKFPFVFGRKTPYLLKSGVYEISPNMSVSQILSELESGHQEYARTVIPEGLTVSKIAEILDEKGVCRKQDFMLASRNYSLLQKYQIPASSFEGFLFPDTYFFTPSMKAATVIEMMADNFLKKTVGIPEFNGKTPSEYYDILILASVVEREYRVAGEAPLIASVFKNRIEKNIGLYSCATIEYIITEILGKPHPDVITYDDLKIDSPYNTYKWAGLPPSPISNPGLVALKAAANPPKTDYYYFTLTDEASGTHTFSRSFSSHTRAGIQFKTKKAASAE